MSASIAAAKEWRSVFSDPGSTAQSHASRQAQYELLWSYYKNAAFEDLAHWHGYRSHFALYRQTRSIYNPVHRLVEFYSGHVYPGFLSGDGSRLPAGVPLAIPLAEDIDPKLKAAIAQFWQWSNWQVGSGEMVTFGAALGNVMVEVVDDLERGKITANIVWPGFVTDLELDQTGNVKSYALEYETADENDTKYTYRKEVDQEEFRFFKDEKPFDYGDGPFYENPYQFVPAVWAKHSNQGGDFGVPAIRGSIGKIDELNGLASHVNDHIHKLINAPMIIGSAGSIVPLFSGKAGSDLRSAVVLDEMSSQSAFSADRDKMSMLKGPVDVKVESLAGNLDLAAAMPYVDHLMSEIERDFPELSFYEQLRSMSALTGPAAARLTGDVGMKVMRAQANYDQQSIKLFQMATAIGGWRLGRGDWNARDSQQSKFAGFDLTSYERGELTVDIMPRPLIMQTEMETVELDLKKAEVAAKLYEKGIGKRSEARMIVIADYEPEAVDDVYISDVGASIGRDLLSGELGQDDLSEVGS